MRGALKLFSVQNIVRTGLDVADDTENVSL